MRQLLLDSLPGISLKEHRDLPVSSYPPLQRRGLKQPILTQRRNFHHWMVQEKESPKIKKILEVKESSDEPGLSQGMQELMKEKAIQNNKALIETDKSFQQAAKNYFQKKEDNPQPLKNNGPLPSGPKIAPNADTANVASMIADDGLAQLSVKSKRKQSAATSMPIKTKPLKKNSKKKMTAPKKGLKKKYLKSKGGSFKLSKF